MKNEEVNFEQARKDWEAGASARAVAAVCGVSHTKINLLVRHESWKRGSTESAPSHETEQQIDDSIGKIEMQRQAVEAAENELTMIRGRLELVRSDDRDWKNRVKELETLRHKAAVQAYEKHLDLRDVDRLDEEKSKLQRHLELIPELIKNFSEREKIAHSRLQEERATLQKIESKAEYIKLREELISGPRKLTDAERNQMRMAAVQGDFRDNFDNLMSVLETFLRKKKLGTEKGFVWPELNLT